jgi:hypothetical protein
MYDAMAPGLFWEAGNPWSGEEILHHLWNLMIRYLLHNTSSPGSNLVQSDNPSSMASYIMDKTSSTSSLSQFYLLVTSSKKVLRFGHINVRFCIISYVVSSYYKLMLIVYSTVSGTAELEWLKRMKEFHFSNWIASSDRACAAVALCPHTVWAGVSPTLEASSRLYR